MLNSDKTPIKRDKNHYKPIREVVSMLVDDKILVKNVNKNYEILYNSVIEEKKML